MFHILVQDIGVKSSMPCLQQSSASIHVCFYKLSKATCMNTLGLYSTVSYAHLLWVGFLDCHGSLFITPDNPNSKPSVVGQLCDSHLFIPSCRNCGVVSDSDLCLEPEKRGFIPFSPTVADCSLSRSLSHSLAPFTPANQRSRSQDYTRSLL